MRRVAVVIFIFIIGAVHAQSGHILFGERDLNYDTPAFYIDKEGSFYPNYPISNSSLDSCNASLLNWYKKHPIEFLSISKQFNCTFDSYSSENALILNDSIVTSLKAKINLQKSNFSSVSFLIHGYRKPFVKSNNDRTAGHDYKIMEERFQRDLKSLYVEVYWDAMYDCCYSTNMKKNKQLYKLLQEAERNALPVGHGLRKLIYGLSTDTINIITHSLGAKVALHTLFNTEDCKLPTPINAKINVCLIAPALSKEDFKAYYNRTTALNFKSNDNYKILIGYNENDFVLRKKVGWFGPGPVKYVNTTLGCNHKGSCDDLKKYFAKQFTNSSISFFNLSSVGQCHLVGCYCSGGHLDEILKGLK